MTVNRGVAASWAIGLGLLLAAIAGTIVSTRTPAEEVRRVAGFALLFVPAVYVMIVSRWESWYRKNPYVRFVVAFIGGFVAIGLSTVPVVVTVGGAGIVASAAEFVAAVAGFALTAWIAFYGGDDRLWAILIDRLDVDW